MSISVRNINKRFGNYLALENLNLDVPSGSLLALLGPSGSGKTTLLRIIAGLETPDSGSILHDDEDVTQTSPRDREVGFVFQHYALFRHMTVFENVAFGLRVRKTPRAEVKARVHELLHLVRLEGLESRYPSQLSGGQRQRVALARALAVQPRLLLLDEPFGALDAKVRLELRQWLRRLHEEIHVTTIFVTHDQEEAMVLSDRIAVMRDGVLQQYSTPDETYSRPANRFVAGFIGSPRMNFIDGDLTVEEGSTAIRSGGTEIPTGPQAAQVLGRHDRPLVMGIRPEHIRLTPHPNGDARGRVELLEPVGPVTYVDVRLGDVPLRASVPAGADLEPGQTVGVAFEPDRLHFFDRESGARISEH